MQTNSPGRRVHGVVHRRSTSTRWSHELTAPYTIFIDIKYCDLTTPQFHAVYSGDPEDAPCVYHGPPVEAFGGGNERQKSCWTYLRVNELVIGTGYAWNPPEDEPELLRASLVGDALRQIVRLNHGPWRWREAARNIARIQRRIAVRDHTPRWAATVWAQWHRARFTLEGPFS